MPPKRKTRQQLKKGDNMVVTIEESAQDCLIVSLIFQNRKFCGALMDTTKRNGPYGIPTSPDSPEDEHKMETRQTPVPPKPSYKTPFPQPLLTRKTYKQDVPQPPLRNIFRRIRRSRRKARLNILRPYRDGALKHRGWKFLAHNANCQCCDCTQGVHEVLSQSSGSGPSGKRKAKDAITSEENGKRVKFQDDTPSSTSSDDDSDAKVSLSEEIVSPIKTLLPRKTQTYKPKMQRSPIIKITYKSPGGRGRVVKIPSKLHHSPSKDTASASTDVTNKKEDNSLAHIEVQEQTQKYKRKSVKPKLLGKAPVDDNDSSPATCIKQTQPKGKRKYVKKSSPKEMENATESVVEIKSNITKANLSRKLKNLQRKAELNSSVASNSSSKNYVMCHPGPKKIKRKYVKKETALLVLNKSGAAGTTIVPEISTSKSQQNNTKAKYTRKSFGKQEQAMKVLKRAKRSTFVIPYEKNTEQMISPSESTSHSSPVKNKHLRVILQPLDDKNGLAPPGTSTLPRDNFIFHSFSVEKSGVVASPTSPQDDKKVVKKSSEPQSHTIYVTTCKSLKGVIFTQGDVVWGKLTGYPWWPSRIVKLIVTKTDGKILQQEAMVGWFRSRTTSIIPLRCVQSFEKYYDVRFEKKRKGLYKKAVSDAQIALTQISPEVRKLISQFET